MEDRPRTSFVDRVLIALLEVVVFAILAVVTSPFQSSNSRSRVVLDHEAREPSAARAFTEGLLLAVTVIVVVAGAVVAIRKHDLRFGGSLVGGGLATIAVVARVWSVKGVGQ